MTNYDLSTLPQYNDSAQEYHFYLADTISSLYHIDELLLHAYADISDYARFHPTEPGHEMLKMRRAFDLMAAIERIALFYATGRSIDQTDYETLAAAIQLHPQLYPLVKAFLLMFSPNPKA